MVSRSLKQVKGLNRWYAILMVKTNNQKRLSLYRKLASMLSNRFNLLDALQRLYQIESGDGKHTGEPFALAIASWMDKLERGQPFAESMRGWVPERESLMLSVGDVSKLSDALLNLIKVIEGSRKIVGLLINAVAYPLFLLMMTILILAMVSLYLVPPLMEAAGGSIRWTGSAATLIGVSHFFQFYWLPFMAVLFIGLAAIFFTMPIFKGQIRVMLDKFPPWSLYRLFTGVGWLLSLSVMIKAGTPLTKAMKMLADQSSPYLSSRLLAANRFIANGDNLGVALKKTKTDFPDHELIGDLQIYSEMDNFQETLMQLSNDYLQDAILKMTRIASTLNSAGILLMSLAISWVVYGTFDMQNQITAHFGS